ncbi:MAG: uroporphyrinogen-III synthase [Gammaproteobacteria bacterium]
MTLAIGIASRRVLLTRSEEDNAEWAATLAERGAEPVALPCIHCESIDTPTLRNDLATATANADWLTFTSRRGVDAFAELHPAVPARAHVAVVGAATAAAARTRFGRVDLIGKDGTAASLGATLARDGDLARRPHVLLALAENAGDTLERALAAAGAHCTRFDVYRTIAALPAAAKRAMSALGADNVIFASPTAVSGFVQQVTVDVPMNVYTIGPSTSTAARAAGLTVTAEAREPSLEGILECMQWQR